MTTEHNRRSSDLMAMEITQLKFEVERLNSQVGILKAERESQERHIGRLADANERIIAHRDTLQAIASAAKDAYVELTNSVDFADNGEAAYVANQNLMCKFDRVFDTLDLTTPQEG